MLQYIMLYDHSGTFKLYYNTIAIYKNNVLYFY